MECVQLEKAAGGTLVRWQCRDAPCAFKIRVSKQSHSGTGTSEDAVLYAEFDGSRLVPHTDRQEVHVEPYPVFAEAATAALIQVRALACHNRTALDWIAARFYPPSAFGADDSLMSWPASPLPFVMRKSCLCLSDKAQCWNLCQRLSETFLLQDGAAAASVAINPPTEMDLAAIHAYLCRKYGADAVFAPTATWRKLFDLPGRNEFFFAWAMLVMAGGDVPDNWRRMVAQRCGHMLCMPTCCAFSWCVYRAPPRHHLALLALISFRRAPSKFSLLCARHCRMRVSPDIVRDVWSLLCETPSIPLASLGQVLPQRLAHTLTADLIATLVDAGALHMRTLLFRSAGSTVSFDLVAVPPPVFARLISMLAVSHPISASHLTAVVTTHTPFEYQCDLVFSLVREPVFCNQIVTHMSEEQRRTLVRAYASAEEAQDVFSHMKEIRSNAVHSVFDYFLQQRRVMFGMK